MDIKNFDFNIANKQEQAASLSKTFISSVFMWMSGALAITALVSYWFASNEALLSLLYSMDTHKFTIFGWVVLLAPIGLVMLMSARFQKLSYSNLTLIFIAYAVLMGMSLSFIFQVYTGGSIAKTFVICSSLFGLMGVLGYTTKTDLTKFGSILMMLVIGLVIAMVVNMFLRSGAMETVISFVGVIIFTGLTAYDVQKLKRIGAGAEYGVEDTKKLVIMGALNLYLDFINLFLFLLRFMGGRK